MRLVSYWPGTISSVTAAPPSMCLFSNTATLLPALARYAAYSKKIPWWVHAIHVKLRTESTVLQLTHSNQSIVPPSNYHCIESSPMQGGLQHFFIFGFCCYCLVPRPLPIQVWIWEWDNYMLPVFFRILLCWVFWCAAIGIICCAPPGSMKKHLHVCFKLSPNLAVILLRAVIHHRPKDVHASVFNFHLARSLSVTAEDKSAATCKLQKAFSLLGVEQDSNTAQIKEAYISMVKKYHPDSKSPHANAKMFSEVCRFMGTPHFTVLMLQPLGIVG